MKSIGKFLTGGAITFAFLFTANTILANQTTPPQARATAAHGIMHLEGEKVIVNVWVNTKNDANPRASAQATLKRIYPEVRLIEHEEFTTNGIVWDNFSDEDSGNNFVTVNYNGKNIPTNLQEAGSPRDYWLNSMATWTSVASSSFVFDDGGDTGRCPSLVRECQGPQKFDGNNDIGWLNISEPNVLGVTWYGTQTDEFDMVLDNTNFQWFIGDENDVGANQFDTQTVWTHEFGHGLGLAHSDVDGSIMEPYYEGVRRLLHLDDITGITSLYPGSSSPTPDPEPTNTPTPTEEPSPGATISATINYSAYGGQESNKHLVVSVEVDDESGEPIPAASVSISLSNGDTNWTGTADTNDSGTVAFTLKNAPSGTYITTITNIVAAGYTWDGQTPTNSYTK
jgi:hypothetical protein